MTNGCIMQYFEWDLPPAKLWVQLEQQAPELARNGITAIWIPPAYKGSEGAQDVGYGTYDLWDLGEFDQRGSVATKYGTKTELLAAIEALHRENIQVYADIVLDHKLGADEPEIVLAKEVDPENRGNVDENAREIVAWTHYFFPGRQKKYSDFEWHWYHFTGIDWDAWNEENRVYLFDGKDWADQVDEEKGNFDYLMGADIDLQNPEVIAELTRWGQWFLKQTKADGFRFDAVKHMRFSFYKNWIEKLRAKEGRELFSVGEYWSPDLRALKNYLEVTEEKFSLFDVPLHYNMLNAATSFGHFDMSHIFDNTLVADSPDLAVTFVDNHDTQPGQALESFIPEWFKPQAYALILLREAGYPCVFYGDYYGITIREIPPKKKMIDQLMKTRVRLAYGAQRDYIDAESVIGWTREGDDEHADSGLAVLLTNAEGGTKTMSLGSRNAGRTMTNLFDPKGPAVKLDEKGCAEFTVPDAALAVWTFAGEKTVSVV